MMYRVCVAFIVFILGITPVILPTSSASADSKFSQIDAVYSIKFNGFPLGKFELKSNLSRGAYSMIGTTKLSVLSGILFEWTGTTHSVGKISKAGPIPASFSFDFRSSDRSENLQMQFKRNRVKSVVANPPVQNDGMRIPVSKRDLRNVVDPMSALVLIALQGKKSAKHNPCNRRIPIFDGKERFDLVMSYKKNVQVDDLNGLKGTAVVCRVKYFPISGHERNNQLAAFLSQSDKIQIWLMSVNEGQLHVPYHIKVPTPFGFATLTTKTLNINGTKQNRLAWID